MKNIERLRSSENSRAPGPEPAILAARLTRERADEILMQRRAMLASIEGDIGITLYGALAAKIEREKEWMLAMLEKGARAAEAMRRPEQVLRHEYFLRKRLDPDIF